MSKKNKRKKPGIWWKLLFIIAAIYAAYVIIDNQFYINKYSAEEKHYLQQIEEEREKIRELEKTKELVDTDYYIEKMAREKLGMVKPGEKIFVDTDK